jgi:hypothetical protein
LLFALTAFSIFGSYMAQRKKEKKQSTNQQPDMLEAE